MVRILTLPFTSSWLFITSIPKRFSIPALLLALLAGTYALWFVLETPVTFAYSGDNCVSRVTFLPDMQKPVSSTPFSFSFHQPIKIFDTTLAARQSCFKLTKVANPDSYQLQVSPFGNLLATSRYLIALPELPKVSISALAKPIPLTKPVVLGLNTHDETFGYALQVNDRESECDSRAKAIHCELTELALEQGKSYEFTVARYFAEKPVGKIAEKLTEILKATTVVDTTIKPDEVVLAKPTELVVTFDKPITKATAVMSKLGREEPEKILAETILGESDLKLTFGELPRQAEFEVKIDKLEALDGSSLVEPYTLRFKTSGGPRVSGVSIPHAGVALGATAVIRFDQELLVDQDVVGQVKVEGGSSSIYRSGNTVVVGLKGIGKCTDFKIVVGNEVQSIHGVSGNSAWSFASRTICHTVEVFGYSVKGRPLLAYYFGSGPATILYTGAIHGSEISSSYLMDNWIGELEANARNLPAGRQIVVVPEINPDGVAARTRNNANNVDLNRNFDVSDWKTDITDTYGNPIPAGGGSAPMSEPETKAIASLVTKLKPRLTINYHSIGGLVIANNAGNSSSLAQAYARLTGYGNATGQSSTTFDYAISGTLDDWMAEKLGLPTVLIELGSHTYSQFPLNKAAMWEMARY